LRGDDMNKIKKAWQIIKMCNPITIYYEGFKAVRDILKARKNA